MPNPVDSLDARTRAFADSTLVDGDPTSTLYDFEDYPRPLPGLAASPRFARELSYPLDDPPSSNALEGLRRAKLCVSPPQCVLDDPVTKCTIASHPELFSVSAVTPYDVDALEQLLTRGPTRYPDQALVLEFLTGMRFGWWPYHDGDFSAVKSFDYPKSADDWAFIEEKGHEGFEAGRYSAAISTPPPGCTFSPTFVRNPVEQKRRWIIDHSGSGLNGGISVELTHPRYDLLSDFIRLLRQLLSTSKQDRPRQIQLWRADVKDAFLGVPMRAEWQMHQLLRFMDADGHEYFRVDRCMEFGSRASPYLWSIVEGFLLHLAQAGGSVPTPLAFVDDAFGADASGRTVIVNVGKKLVRHPPQLAGMIEVFKSVGAPFAADKQLAGSRLRILGIEVDAAEGTITVPDDQKRRFALLSDELLTPKPHGIAIYRTWLGRAQFVGVATPWAKWRLNLLYKAVAQWEHDKGRHPTAKRRLKVEERRAVEAYLDEVLSSAPLSIFDATLQRWPMSACDVVVWSDSCGRAHDGKGGLGFACTTTVARTATTSASTTAARVPTTTTTSPRLWPASPALKSPCKRFPTRAGSACSPTRPPQSTPSMPGKETDACLSSPLACSVSRKDARSTIASDTCQANETVAPTRSLVHRHRSFAKNGASDSPTSRRRRSSPAAFRHDASRRGGAEGTGHSTAARPLSQSGSRSRTKPLRASPAWASSESRQA